MESLVVELMKCPHCGGELRQNGGSLICSRGHTMNIARQGYVSLLGRDAGTHTADSAVMIAARERFLAAGHFQPLIEALVEESIDAPAGAVVDLGCGTGQYLAAILDQLPDRVGIGIDNSKFAARRAAKSHQRVGAIVADIWDEVPLNDDVVGLMINVFSPRNGDEMERILAPGGRLIVVTPQPEHLAELIKPFEMISVDPAKEERLDKALGSLAANPESKKLNWTMKLGREDVKNLIEMGPSAGRMDETAMNAALEGLDDETEVTAAVTITTTTN